MRDMIPTESKTSFCGQAAFYGNSTSTCFRCSCTTTSFLILYIRRFLSPFPRFESTSWCAALASCFSHCYTCAALKHQQKKAPGNEGSGRFKIWVGTLWSRASFLASLCCWLLDLVQPCFLVLHDIDIEQHDKASAMIFRYYMHAARS